MASQRTGAAGAAFRIQVSRTERPAPAARMGLAPHRLPLDEVIVGDCIAALERLPPGGVDLVLPDPPYNLDLEGAPPRRTASISPSPTRPTTFSSKARSRPPTTAASTPSTTIGTSSRAFRITTP